MNFATAVPAFIVLLAATAAAADPQMGQLPYQISHGTALASQGEWPWQLGGIQLPPPHG